MDTLQAAILNVKLKYLDRYIANRQQAADFYDKQLGPVEWLSIPERVSYSTHVFHQYTILIKNGSRDEINKLLAKNSIPSMIYYPVSLHKTNAYGFAVGDLPTSELLALQVLSLPMHTQLTREQLLYIGNTIATF